MPESTALRIEVLANGLTLSFYDQSNRYFGDFHRAMIVIEGAVDLNTANFTDEQKSALAALPDSVLFRRELERMGVTGEHLSSVVRGMIDSFLTSTKNYLGRPDIPAQLLKKKLTEKVRKRSFTRFTP